MGRTAWRSGALILVGAALLAGAMAGARADGDAAALRAYALSLDKVHAYAAAAKALDKAAAGNPALLAEVDALEDQPRASLADRRAQLARHPKVLAFYQHEKLSLEDAVLLPLVATSALAALDAPPDQIDASAVDPDQIAFARRHRAELEMVFMGGGNAQD